MPDDIEIQSRAGPYRVHFVDDGPAHANAVASAGIHFIVDARVADLYAARLGDVIAAPSLLRIQADERAKSLEQMPAYVQHLAAKGFRRNHRLVAIGGGVIQDVTCFLAATMMRGVDWLFFPTTLLAQADSCIGSKSSINVGEAKNIMGTFTPPREVILDVGFLQTLDERDVRSGVGEILKVHAIAGPEEFARLSRDYERLFADKPILEDYVHRALLIKKPFIEIDELDLGPRQVFNYGHSFGHAIESTTNFAIPHGIAVTMGMDLANFVAWRLGTGGPAPFTAMHPILRRNYHGYERLAVPVEPLLAALGRDKKNVGAHELTLILPGADGRPARTRLRGDDAFVACCVEYFNDARVR